VSGFEFLQMEIVGGERNHCRQLSSRDLRQPYISGAADASPPAAGNASPCARRRRFTEALGPSAHGGLNLANYRPQFLAGQF